MTVITEQGSLRSQGTAEEEGRKLTINEAEVSTYWNPSSLKRVPQEH